VLVVDDMACCL